jgi:hypothetical protein
MDKSIFGNKVNLGALTGLTKKVAVAAETAKTEVAKAASNAGFASDKLVKGASAAPAAVNNALAVELKLAKNFAHDAESFARNMAKSSLSEMAAGLGKLANSERTEAHVKALASKIQADPSFSLLHDTARKMAEKHLGD